MECASEGIFVLKEGRLFSRPKVVLKRTAYLDSHGCWWGWRGAGSSFVAVWGGYEQSACGRVVQVGHVNGRKRGSTRHEKTREGLYRR